MTTEQVDRRPSVFSKIGRKLGEIIFHRDGTQTSAKEEITPETVGTKLQEIQRKFTHGHPASQIDPKSADQVRQTLSLTEVSFKKDGVLAVSPMFQTTLGLVGFSIEEAVAAEDGALNHDSQSAFDHVSVLLDRNSEDGSPRSHIQTIGIKGTNGDYKKIEGYSIEAGAVSLGLLNALAETVLASEQPKKV